MQLYYSYSSCPIFLLLLILLILLQEGFSLIGSKNWLKIVRRMDCLLFGTTIKASCCVANCVYPFPSLFYVLGCRVGAGVSVDEMVLGIIHVFKKALQIIRT